jgi:hypothetical protein
MQGPVWGSRNSRRIITAKQYSVCYCSRSDLPEVEGTMTAAAIAQARASGVDGRR